MAVVSVAGGDRSLTVAALMVALIVIRGINISLEPGGSVEGLGDGEGWSRAIVGRGLDVVLFGDAVTDV